MENINVLMTGVGGPGARGYIHSLLNNGERKISIVGTDIKERENIDIDTLNELSTYYTIPQACTKEYLLMLLEICRREKIKVLLPLNTIELEYLSENKEKFENIGTVVCVMQKEILSIANNKIKLLEKLKECGISVPKFEVISNTNEFDQKIKNIGYPNMPICIKRPDANGSRGLRFIDASISGADLYLNYKPHSLYISYNQMIEILPEALKQTKLLVMEKLTGQEYSVDSVAVNGKVVCSVCRRVDKVVDSINVDSTLIQQKEVLNYCDKITETLKLDGCFGFDLKMNEKNEPMILEINPRLQATTILSVMGGANFPYYAIKAALNEPIEPPTIKDGIRITQRTQKLFHDVDGNIFYRM